MPAAESKLSPSLLERLNGLPPVLPFLLFALILIFSNFHDWDYFRAPLEAERRSWLLDGQIPLWSYQLCGGLTRLGDPDSFGLSPSFILVLLLGSLWGAKAIMLLHALVGFYFTKRLFTELPLWVAPANADKESTQRIGTALALAFALGNYFVWHLHVGHLNFSATYLSLGVIYYAAKALMCGLGRKDFIGATLITWWFFSGGFYPGTVYLLIPLYLFLLLPIAMHFFKHLRTPERNNFLVRLSQCCGFHLLGMAGAFYKIAGVWLQQEAYPRTPADTPDEVVGLGRILLSQFSPTIQENFAGIFPGNAAFQVHEYSAFSAISLLALLCVGLWLISLKRKDGETPTAYTSKNLGAWIAFLLLSALLFSFGETVWSPHRWLQEIIYKNSVRAVGRYQIFVHFSLALFVLYSVHKHSQLSAFIDRYGSALVTLIIILNFSTFLPKMSLSELQEQLSLEYRVPTKMQEITVTSEIKRAPSVLKGHALLNCYSGLTHPMRFMKDGLWYSPNKEGYYEHTMQLLHHPRAELSATCTNESYFTQHEIVISESCPEHTCIQLNDLSPIDKQKFVYDKKVKRFCTAPK